MPDFNVRSDSVNVEQIMDQIRARIREKRGVDYTEQEVRDATIVKSLLAPDLRIGEELDAISFGFRIHATRVP